jgi:hypothetical protein
LTQGFQLGFFPDFALLDQTQSFSEHLTRILIPTGADKAFDE